METLKRVALALVIIGAINWGLIGFFQFDLVAAIFGGQAAAISRVVYALVGISGLLCLGMLFSPMEEDDTDSIPSTTMGGTNYATEFSDETDILEEEEEYTNDKE